MSVVLVILILLALLSATSEMGFWIGKRFRKSVDDGSKSNIGTIQGATFTLLSLLLGFVVSMADSRFDLRKRNALDEANAIGTAYLRSKVFSEPERDKFEKLIRGYINLRLEFYDENFNDDKELALQERTSAVQQELWLLAASLARKDPQSLPASLFLTALNDLIDFSEKQTIAFHNYIPISIVGLLFFVSLIAMGATGYLRGLSTGRHLWFSSLVALLIAMTLFVILDLDRPRNGLIRTKYKSILRLQASVQKPSVSP